MPQHAPEQFLCRDGRALIIRHLRPEDATQYQTFNDIIASETIYTLRYPGRVYSTEDWAANWLKDSVSRVNLSLGAFENSRLVAQIGLHVAHPGHPWVKHIGQFGMMILKEYWDQGLGKKMLGLILDHAKRAQVMRVEATVRAVNGRAMRMYANAGFAVEGTRKNAAFINGEYHDEYTIAKIIS